MKTLQQFNHDDEAAVNQDMMTTLSCLSKKETHLPMVVWIEVKRSEDDWRTPMIRFANNTSDSLFPDDLIPMSICIHPRILVTDFELKITDTDLRKLRLWIISHRDTLLKHWHGEIDFINCCRAILPEINI